MAPLAKAWINIRLLRPSQWPPTPAEIEDQISPRTRVLCCSWVFSFFGAAIDLKSIGAMCRQRGVLFVVNGSQAVGAREIDVSRLPVDALVSCGFKWQCGPYATGFAWIRSEVLDDLTYEQTYWLAHGGARSTS
jgi:cysteine desulfurase/selenocysteine lyase